MGHKVEETEERKRKITPSPPAAAATLQTYPNFCLWLLRYLVANWDAADCIVCSSLGSLTQTSIYEKLL